MSRASEELLKSFDELPEPEKHEFVKLILRRSLEWRYAPLTDEELTLNAEAAFLELRNADGDPQSG